MSSCNPEKNSTNNSQMNFNFGGEIDSVFKDYLKNLNPEENSMIEFDDTNLLDCTTSFVGSNNVDSESDIIVDPFADDLSQGTLFTSINNPVQKNEWEDLEDDVHQ